MKWSGGRGDDPDLQSHVVFIRWTNLVLGFVRLCCSLSQLHRGVLGSVTGWIFSSAHRECLERVLASSAEVRSVRSSSVALFLLLFVPFQPSLVSYVGAQVVFGTVKLFMARVGNSECVV